jgi:hypothetical protein
MKQLVAIVIARRKPGHNQIEKTARFLDGWL